MFYIFISIAIRSNDHNVARFENLKSTKLNEEMEPAQYRQSKKTNRYWKTLLDILIISLQKQNVDPSITVQKENVRDAKLRLQYQAKIRALTI
jgi:hypothetical protein